MNEPTIACPNCRTEIRLTESLAAPLIAATRLEFERKLSEKDEAMGRRERELRTKERAVVEAGRELDQRVVDQVAARLIVERQRLAAEEALVLDDACIGRAV